MAENSGCHLMFYIVKKQCHVFWVSETRALVFIYSLVNENAAGFCCVESDCLLLIHVANNALFQFISKTNQNIFFETAHLGKCFSWVLQVFLPNISPPDHLFYYKSFISKFGSDVQSHFFLEVQ